MHVNCALHPYRIAWALLVGVLGAFPSVCPGDDADDIAAAIVRQTPNQAEAAGKILAAARLLNDSPGVQIRLCEKAYEQGMAAAGGYGTAIAALNILERVAPTRIDSWRAKRLDVYRLQYYRSTRASKADNGGLYVKLLLVRAKAAGKSGNWKDAATYYRQAYTVARTLNLPEKQAIYDDLRAAGSYEMIHNRVEVLRAALAKNPGDLFSRKQLVMTHLVDLDKPHEAAKYLNSKVDPALGKNVTLATKEASALGDADFMALGMWYRSLSAKAPLKHTKIRMLTRALDNMHRYLEVYTKQDARRLRAMAQVTLVEAELKRLGADVASRKTFLPGIVLAMSFEKGQWTRAADGAVTVKDISGRAGEPLTCRMRRGTPGVTGKVGTGIAFPAGSRAHLDIPVKVTAGLQAFTFAFWVKTTESGSGSSYWKHPTFLGMATGALGSRDYGITTSRGYIGYWNGLAPKRDFHHQSSSVRINDGAWHHIAMTNDGKTMLLYVDARLVAPKGLPTGQTLTTMPVPIGGSRSDSRGQPTVCHHSGTYDEFQFYNRALTAEEIAGMSRRAIR